MKNLKEFKLEHFIGTEEYHVHQLLGNVLLLTDGCHYVREEAKAYWLFDAILSYQTHPKVKNEPFQSWILQKVEVNANIYWPLTCDDGDEENTSVFIKQTIAFSDFPLNKIQFFVIDGVCMLISEY